MWNVLKIVYLHIDPVRNELFQPAQIVRAIHSPNSMFFAWSTAKTENFSQEKYSRLRIPKMIFWNPGDILKTHNYIQNIRSDDSENPESLTRRPTVMNKTENQRNDFMKVINSCQDFKMLFQHTKQNQIK